jgi:hypothetical protein
MITSMYLMVEVAVPENKTPENEAPEKPGKNGSRSSLPGNNSGQSQEKENATVGKEQSPTEKMYAAYQAEAREYREFLQNMLNRVLWIIYAVAFLLVLVPSALGIKTFWDIETRIKDEVSSAVERIVNEDFVDEVTTKELQHKQDSIVVAYWRMRMKRTEEAFHPEQISRADLLSIGRVLDDPTSWAFEDALAAFPYCWDFPPEFNQRYKASVVRHLNKEWQSDSGLLDDRTEQMIIRSLASCRSDEAYNLLMFAIEHDVVVSEEVSETALLYLHQVTPFLEREKTGKIVREMAEDSSKHLRGLMLAVAMMLSPNETAPHLMELAESDEDRSCYISTLTVLIEEATRLDLGLSKSELESLSEVLAAFLLDDGVSLVAELRNPKIPVVVSIKIDGEWRGLPLTPDQVYNEAIQRAMSKAIKDCQPENCQGLLRRVMIPITALGSAIYAREQAEGRIGYAADPFVWRDGFFLSVDGEEMLLDGYKGNAVILLRSKGEKEPPVSLSKPVKEIRLSSAKWRIQSVGYGRRQSLG